MIGVYERKDIQAAVADGSLNSDDRYFMQGMHGMAAAFQSHEDAQDTQNGRQEHVGAPEHSFDRKAFLEASSYLRRLRDRHCCWLRCTP